MKSVAMLAATCLVVAGCFEEEEPPGTLIVPFKLGNDKDCNDFDVERVRGELDSGDEDAEVYEESVRCEAGKLQFDQIPAGSYRLRLFGYDNDEHAVMDNLGSEDLTVNVIGDETVLADRAVMLTPAPANLRVRWAFGFGSCKSAGIDTFLINVWRGDGSDMLLEYEMDCDQIGEGEEFYREVPDTKRKLAGDVVGLVTIQPLSSNGGEVGDPLEFEFESPGPGRDIRLSFECGEEYCECSGTPDD